MSPVRSEIRYQRLQEGEERQEGEELSIHLYSPGSAFISRRLCRETCLRLLSSLLLLVVAAGFVLYELDYRNKDVSDGLPPLSSLNQLQEPHHHHHDGSQTSHHDDAEEEQDQDQAHHHSGDTYHQGVAVTDSETCSMLARDILQAKGSVVDAGIVAVLCLAVVHPHTSSLGGVFSSIYFDGKSKKSSSLNAISGEASPVFYGVPEVLQGLWLLHQKHGRKPWSELLSSAAILANEGFLVDASLHAALEVNRDKVLASTGLCHLFCGPNQSLKEVGERVRNPELGKLLEQVTNSMKDSALPDDIILSLTSESDVTGREKLAEALSRKDIMVEDPETLHLDGLTVFTSTGPTTGNMLSGLIRDIYNKTQVQSSRSDSETLLNSSKLVYALSGAWPRELSSDFSSQPSPPWNPAPVSCNIIIADSHGDMFVLSLTINSTFGSGVVSPSTGILLSDFIQGLSSLQSLGALYWACPTVLVYGADNDVMGLSASGGSSVPFSLAQVIYNHLLLDKDLTESVSESLVEVPPQSSDPWLGYLGLQGKGTEALLAVEVQAEHVHVVKSHGPCCYPAGL